MGLSSIRSADEDEGRSVVRLRVGSLRGLRVVIRARLGRSDCSFLELLPQLLHLGSREVAQPLFGFTQRFGLGQKLGQPFPFAEQVMVVVTPTSSSPRC